MSNGRFARHLFIRQQTAVINSIRAYLAEFGIVAPVACDEQAARRDPRRWSGSGNGFGREHC
jgi:hypothetical protein